jgi:uncharacterized surface protein with fasciclin (FAS1) repeats
MDVIRRNLLLAALAAPLAACASDNPPPQAQVAPAAGPPQAPRSPDIVETAVRAGEFQTLAEALQAAGMVEALRQPGPYTVFAPTDAAFARLPRGQLERLLQPENREQLRALLAYHVVPGTVTSSDLAGQRVRQTTVGGRDLTINGRGRGVRVNNATVTAPDVTASNGVIHAIDRVLIPPRA